MKQNMFNGHNIVFLDLETTGFSPSLDDIIEIGAWHFCDGVARSKFSVRVKPERYISEEVQRLTGIKNSDLVDCEPITTVLPEFIDYVGNFDIAGYNLCRFDYNFLCSKAKNLGLDFTLNGTRRGIDLYKSVKKYFPNLKSYKLSDVCSSLGIPFTDTRLHTAEYDAYLTKLLYDRCPKELPYLLDNSKYGRSVIKDTLSFY